MMGVPTLWVFLDYPEHREFSIGEYPLLEEGTVVIIETTLPAPRRTTPWTVSGPYRVSRRVLRHGPSGLRQYLEWCPDTWDR